MPNTPYMQIRIKHVDQELNLKCCWWLLWKDDENEKTVTMSLILMIGSHMCTQCLLRNINEGSSREEDWHLCSDSVQVSGSVCCYILECWLCSLIGLYSFLTGTRSEAYPVLLCNIIEFTFIVLGSIVCGQLPNNNFNLLLLNFFFPGGMFRHK